MHTHGASGSPPRSATAASHLATGAAWLELRGVEKAFAARGWSPHRAPPAPLVATARLRRGECVLVCGERCATTALLWCVAGLTTPDRGELCWLTAVGQPAAPPRRAFVAAGWRGYDCWTPRDALEAAVPAGTPQREADERLARVRRLGLVPPDRTARLAELGAGRRWLVGVAAAVAGGARWLLLEPPALDAADASRARGALWRLRLAGLTMLAATPEGWAAIVPAHRALWLPAPAVPLDEPRGGSHGAPHDEPGARARWRVAELSASDDHRARAAGASVDPSMGAP